MKQCAKCKKELPLSQFHLWKARGGHQSICKECRRAIDAKRYADNASLRRKQSKRLIQKNTQMIRKLKDGPCIDCGEKFHFSAMQFDHRPGEIKLFNVADGGMRGATNKLLAEIAKCDLVCANCHAVRTWNRQQSLSHERD